jgi:flagellar hook-basal body complex protein FliE
MSNGIESISRLVPGLQNGINSTSKVADANEDKEANFSEVFGKLLNSVNSMQMDAAKAQELLASGDAAELHQVMIAAEEAGVALDLLLEIRNKLVDAYQTIMRMPM